MYNPEILRVSSLIAAVALVGLGCGGCDDEPPAGAGTTQASGVAPLSNADSGTTTPGLLSSAVAKLDSKRSTHPSPNPEEALGMRWSFSPKALRVYRATQVQFRLERAPKGHEAASCSWNFGDGKTTEGCTVTHTFMGGLADEVVTLTVQDGDWEYRSKRTIPLERLEVVPGLLESSEPLANARTIPPRAAPSDRTFRFAVMADTASESGLAPGVRKAVDVLNQKVKPELVIHAGGIGSSDLIADSLTSGGAKVAFGLAPSDRPIARTLKVPGVQLLEGSEYPRRYSFTHKGIFFMVVSTDEATDGESVSEDTMSWMRKQLASARIYEARYVISYLPVRKFTETHVGTLDKSFRLYELFLRGRVTAFITGAYRVFYRGKYGALDVVSVGSLAGPGGKLIGSDFQQPASFVAVDIVKGVPKRTFAVEGPDFDRIVDERSLPKNVGMYTFGR